MGYQRVIRGLSAGYPPESYQLVISGISVGYQRVMSGLSGVVRYDWSIWSMYWPWWFLIWMIDVIDVLTLGASDITDWYDQCIDSGAFWYNKLMWLMYLHWWFLIWLIGVIDVLTSTVTQLLMYLMQSNFRLLWNVKCTNASQYGEYMSVVHCTL